MHTESISSSEYSEPVINQQLTTTDVNSTSSLRSFYKKDFKVRKFSEESSCRTLFLWCRVIQRSHDKTYLRWSPGQEREGSSLSSLSDLPAQSEIEPPAPLSPPATPALAPAGPLPLTRTYQAPHFVFNCRRQDPTLDGAQASKRVMAKPLTSKQPILSSLYLFESKIPKIRISKAFRLNTQY